MDRWDHQWVCLSYSLEQKVAFEVFPWREFVCFQAETPTTIFDKLGLRPTEFTLHLAHLSCTSERAPPPWPFTGQLLSVREYLPLSFSLNPT